MRHFTLLLVLSLFTLLSLEAQRDAVPTASSISGFGAARMMGDTLFSPTLIDPCSDEVFIYEPGDGETGYVGGTNSFLDKEKAILLTYDVAEDFEVTEVVAYFFPPDDAAILDLNLYAFVSEVNVDGSPGDLIAESEPIAISDLNTEEGVVQPTFFTFSTPVALSSSSFFVSIDFTEVYQADSGDIGLWMTDDGCAADPNPSWELWDDDTWHNIEDSDSWGLENEWLLGAVVSIVSSTRTPLVDLQLTLSPNPSAGLVLLDYSFERSTNLELELYNAMGQVAFSSDLGWQVAGRGQQTIDLNHLPAGQYHLRLTTDDGISSQTLILE
ncbi:MAG: T9SS type A sorting domain-containing protein [Bacteroidota bacterium]